MNTPIFTENWNTIILGLAMSGGIVTHQGNKYKVTVLVNEMNPYTNKMEDTFKSFYGSRAEYDMLIEDSFELKDQINNMIEEEDKKQEEEKKKQEEKSIKKSQTKQNKKGKEKTLPINTREPEQIE